jgi:hypothetical protein
MMEFDAAPGVRSSASAVRRMQAPSLLSAPTPRGKQGGEKSSESIDFIGRARGPGFQRKRIVGPLLRLRGCGEL